MKNSLEGLQLAPETKKQNKGFWERTLVHPDSRFKTLWDLLIIIFAVYNAIFIPYEFWFTIKDNIFLTVVDRTIDALFMTDIVINFRTIYRDSRTDEEIRDSKKIALRYLIYGRFGIDLFASVPLELIITGSSNLRIIALLKMVRLLRLGRIITFLKTNQKLKISMKLGQLVFFLILAMHWISCFWNFITSIKETWYPPKNVDSGVTNIYNADDFTIYWVYFYYAILTIVGAEIIPTNPMEVLSATLVLVLGMIMIGIIIGEFASLLSEYTKKERLKSEEVRITL